MKPASVMSDADFTKHLERVHGYSAMTWEGTDRRLFGRNVWLAYHDHLHRTDRTHKHEEDPNMAVKKGWVQQTACICLDPPKHTADCTGKNGTVELGERHGPSIREVLWEEMDSLMERLMTGADAEDGGDKFRAQGIAYSLAVFQNPKQPDIESVRAEAVRRWKEQHNG